MPLIKYTIPFLFSLLSCIMTLIDIKRFKIKRNEYRFSYDELILYLKEVNNSELLEFIENHQHLFSSPFVYKKFTLEIKRSNSLLTSKLKKYYMKYYDFHFIVVYLFVNLIFFTIFIYLFVFIIVNNEVNNFDIIFLIFFLGVIWVLLIYFLKVILKKYDLKSLNKT